jgi:hypothetical protein
MSFNIATPSHEEISRAIETPFNDLYEEFVGQFDRVSPVGDGWGKLESSDGQILPKLTRNPDYLKGIDGVHNDLRTSREVEISKGVVVGNSPVWGAEFYASYLTLSASGVKNEDSKVWVPGVSMRYDALIPQPLQLMREFGLDMTVRIRPFDDFGNNRRTVFDTGAVTEANEDSYEATMVKPALYVVTQAFAGLPDVNRAY